MLGISIYPEKQDKNEIFNYLELAHKYGFKRIFSCLLSATTNKDETIKIFSEINEYAHKLGFTIILDVNPRVFDQFGASYDDLTFFSELKADGIRLDMGFDGKKEADMTFNPQNLMIEINISNDNKYFDNILSYNPNKEKLIASHNFYPQAYTGLSLDFFKRITQKFKDNNIKTAAFITSHSAKVGPWVLSHGLVSLEILRNMRIDSQYKFYIATGLIDDTIIGNSFASEEELKLLSKVDQNPIISFRLEKDSIKNNTEIENTILFNNPHFRRGDTNDYSVRSTQSRVKYKSEDFTAHNTPEILRKGDVVICNNNYGQYKGELQIILQEQKNIDYGKSVVGRIVEEEIILLDYLKPLERFTFEK